MSSGSRRIVVVVGILALCALGFGAWNQLTSGVSGTLYAVHFPKGTRVGYVVGADMDSIGNEVGLVIKTTDGGATWVQQDPGVVHALRSVYFKDDSTGYAVGQLGAAIRTTNGGDTWTAMSVPGTDLLNRVQFPENSMTGYIGFEPRGGGSKVLRTTDGGENWLALTIGGTHSYSCGMGSDSFGVVVGYGGLVYGTSDGFGTYSSQGPQTTADIVAAAFAPEDPEVGYLIGNDSTHGVIRYTNDGGSTLWDSVRCWYVTALHGVDVATNDVAYVCGDSAGVPIIMRSVFPTDFSRTTLSTGFSGSIADVCFPNGADTGFAVGAGGAILRTNDGGYPYGGHWVSEAKTLATLRTAIRVSSNPSRRGIGFSAEAGVNVIVFDAAGRVVVRLTAAKGANFIPLSKAGVYVVKAVDGRSSTTKVVVQP